jgi:dTDP-4-dehydrorhamnose 3,5-epimerase
MNYFVDLVSESHKFEDDRGNLEVLYETSNFVLKRSFSKKNVFRGLHVQKAPFLQTKLIRVISGEIIDFLVDINSDTKKVFKKKITPDSDWIKIDSQFAHGFYAAEDTVFEYICDGVYNELFEESYSIQNHLEKELLLKDLLMSEKDRQASKLLVQC